MPLDQAQAFTARKEAMQLYFAGKKVRDIERKTGVRWQKLASMAQKCLRMAPDGQVYGYRALIPYIRTSSYQRRAELKTKRQHQQGGQAGALSLVLQRFPDIEDELVRNIRQSGKRMQIPEHRLRAKDLHRIFIQYLKSKDVSETEWPFTTRYLGLHTIQKYMARVLSENFCKSVMSREGAAAKAHINVGTGHAPFLIFNEPYDAVEIDAYKIDAHLTVAFQTPEGTLAQVLLERLWLIAAVERASTAMISYTMVYRSEVTSDDVVRVIRDAVTKKWQPKALTLPLNYPSTGGLPSGVIPEAYGAVWNLLLLDGALAHLSHAVHSRARRELGFSISWGAPGHFERRPNVERTFRRIADDIFKRLPSTTGSNPNNGRAQDGRAQALQHKIRADEAEQILDVYIAQHNATPSEGISYLTPLDYLRHFLANDSQSGFILRSLPETTRQRTHMFAVTEEVTVRGGIKDGRRPYIQLDRVHYTSPVLVELGNLIGEKLLIEIDEEDMRQVKAYLKNGAELGFLTAKGRWSTTKHSRRTRKAINSLMAKRILVISEFEDPVRRYLGYLSTPQGKKNNPELTPRQATDATRVAKESEQPLIITATPQPVQNEIGVKGRTVSDLGRRRSLVDRAPPLLQLVKNRR